MPPLKEMHKLVARSPRAQAKFYLLMDDIVERHLYGSHQSYVGKHCLAKSIHDSLQDDDLPSSGDPGLFGFAIADLGPGESQQRGAHHRHS